MNKGNNSVWYYIRQYKFRSLLIKNFVFVLLVVIMPMLLVTVLGYVRLSNTMNVHLLGMNDELLTKSAAVTDNVLQDISDKLDQVARQQAVIQVIGEKDILSEAGRPLMDEAFRCVHEYTGQNQYIGGIYIYSDVNDCILDMRRETVRTADSYSRKEKWYYIHKLSQIDSQYVLANHQNSAFFCHPILSSSGEQAGVMVFDIQLIKILELLKQEDLLQNGVFFLTGMDGEIIYNNQTESMTDTDRIAYQRMISKASDLRAEMRKNGGNRFVSVTDSVYQSWRYALITELRQFEDEVETLGDFLFTAVIVGLVTSVLVTYVITLVTYRPVKKIVNVIEKHELSSEGRYVTKTDNELLYITSNILNTLSSKDQMDKELKRRMEALRKAQSLALQFQIDPHFLYNTLEMIKWCSVEEIGFGNRTGKLLTKVAKLYRIGLETNNVLLTLREEMDFLALYVDILSARFGENICFFWDVDPSLHSCLVIKMCIQPLIENAVNHGLRLRNYTGNIWTRAYQAKDKLCVTVENDGQGMEAAEIVQINLRLKTRTELGTKKVGLYNVNERVKLIYGDEYGVTLSERSGEDKGGLAVTITFPFDKKLEL